MARGLRITEQELSKLQNARMGKQKAGKMTTNALTRAVLGFLDAHNVSASRTNTMGVFDIKKAGKKLHELFRQKFFNGQLPTIKEVENVLRGSYRRSHERIGKPDISGHHKKFGFAVYVEIKTGYDSLGPEQIWFLREAKRAGCIAIEARDFDDFMEEYERQFTELTNKFK